jgi:hypothetical protein
MAYHGVKTVRRELRALTGRSGQLGLPMNEYHRWMRSISDYQLAFEELMRMAPLANEALDGLAQPSVPDEKGKYSENESVGGRYRAIEQYLNGLITEYTKLPSQVRSDGSVTIPRNKQVHKLNDFVLSDGLQSGVSHHVAKLCEVYRASLLRPTELDDASLVQQSQDGHEPATQP